MGSSKNIHILLHSPQMHLCLGQPNREQQMQGLPRRKSFQVTSLVHSKVKVSEYICRNSYNVDAFNSHSLVSVMTAHEEVL